MTTQPLADYLAAAYEAPEDDEARAAHRIGSPDEAAWAARKLAKARAEMLAIENQADAEIERIRRWQHDASRQADRDFNFFTGLLTDWHRQLLDIELTGDAAGDWERVRHKSRRLPNGVVVAARRNPDAWRIDGEVFVPWAEASGHADLVKVEKAPRVAEARKALTAAGTTVVAPETGEVVPGIAVVPGEVAITVKVEAEP